MRRRLHVHERDLGLPDFSDRADHELARRVFSEDAKARPLTGRFQVIS
jgi:hypothetical protein